MTGLPVGWVPAEIGDICDLINGKAFKPSDWTSEGLPIVRIQNLNKPDAPYNRFSGEVGERFRLHGEELLFAWSGTPGTSFGAHIWKGGNAVLNQHIYNVRFPEGHIDKKFLKYAINQKLEELIDLAHGGVGLRHVTKGMVERTGISLPPQNEQRRIVEKVESLQGRSTRARDELGHIPWLIERYKQAVLSKAFRGDISPGVTFTSVQFKDMIASTKNGLSKRLGDTGSPVRVLRLADLSQGRFAPEAPRKIHLDEKERRAFGLSKGDLVCIRVNGSAKLVGRMFVFNAEDEWAFCDHFIRFRLDTAKYDPEYVAAYFSSEPARRELESWFVSTAGQKTVSQKSLGKLILKVPPIKTQQEIVAKIVEANAWIDRIAQEHQGAARLLNNLDQAILAKAFRGELVPQDPDDEPASVLLERIREERAKQPKTKRGRKKKEGKA